MLYPKTNHKRMAISLNGLWKFAFVNDDFQPLQPLKEDLMMGVPGSFNDIFTTLEKRDYVGKVCYEYVISIPELDGSWNLYLGAAPHHTDIYINGKWIKENIGGYLPIHCDIPYSQKIRISLVIDNRLFLYSHPMGEVIKIGDKEKQNIHFDFFNYSGIHRNVFLYHLPPKPIDDIIIKADYDGKSGVVSYNIISQSDVLNVKLLDPKGAIVGSSSDHQKMMIIDHPILWDINMGHLYTLCVETKTDFYEETFGIRHIEIKDKKLYLNFREIYLKGFGMHEDHVSLGKGSISSLNVRDFELLKWIGANSFRTSHYPYAEEMYELADRYGILIINEMPAVGLNFWSPRIVFSDDNNELKRIENYKKQFDTLIRRDKNHPSVIMYSLANEANTHEEGSLKYFKEIVNFARERTELPLMIVEYIGAENNQVAHLFDVIGLNRYMAWYSDFGDLSVVQKQLTHALKAYIDRFDKPLVLTEFGADTIAGFHSLPALAFSEEYQVEFIETYLKTISHMKGVIGEHVWNFADFQTKQGLTRFMGNKKGVFTRDRQPKMVAHTLRKYWMESK